MTITARTDKTTHHAHIEEHPLLILDAPEAVRAAWLEDCYPSRDRWALTDVVTLLPGIPAPRRCSE